ncbi:hypothetical protein KO481_39180 [Nocardia sp. NEAU-G5]|uniref:DUF2946 domain-containing protein n=1 Tax=Nocardia albiluteola TaxID=2842303 RepID=A0ABS6BB67_9NOCA|nr:DUF6153 family protein [Nocardia albiluteola]MBU3067533.1 hypothetical protein [Nocardia albiluteola]
MIDRRQTSAPGYVRALGLWALLAGVLVMHIVALIPARMMHAGHVAGQSITTSAVAGSATAEDPAMPMAGRPGSAMASAVAARVISDTQPGTSLLGPARLGGSRAQPVTATALAGTHPSPPISSRAMAKAPRAIPDSDATTPSAAPAVPMRAMAGMGATHGCDCGGCGMTMAEMHACVFILTALTLLLGLALLGRISGRTADSARPAPRWLSRRARPPPWTMPSLAELSILRI